MAATNAPFWITNFGNEEDVSSESPSPDDVRKGIQEGLSIFSEIFGAVVGIVGDIAILADGTQVPVAELGVTYANDEPLPPATWIEGVPNAATLALGIGAVVLLVAVLR